MCRGEPLRGHGEAGGRGASLPSDRRSRRPRRAGWASRRGPVRAPARGAHHLHCLTGAPAPTPQLPAEVEPAPPGPAPVAVVRPASRRHVQLVHVVGPAPRGLGAEGALGQDDVGGGGPVGLGGAAALEQPRVAALPQDVLAADVESRVVPRDEDPRPGLGEAVPPREGQAGAAAGSGAESEPVGRGGRPGKEGAEGPAWRGGGRLRRRQAGGRGGPPRPPPAGLLPDRGRQHGTVYVFILCRCAAGWDSGRGSVAAGAPVANSRTQQMHCEMVVRWRT